MLSFHYQVLIFEIQLQIKSDFNLHVKHNYLYIILHNTKWEAVLLITLLLISCFRHDTLNKSWFQMNFIFLMLVSRSSFIYFLAPVHFSSRRSLMNFTSLIIKWENWNKKYYRCISNTAAFLDRSTAMAKCCNRNNF